MCIVAMCVARIIRPLVFTVANYLFINFKVKVNSPILRMYFSLLYTNSLSNFIFIEFLLLLQEHIYLRSYVFCTRMSLCIFIWCP